jgi:hypothetical protein
VSYLIEAPEPPSRAVRRRRQPPPFKKFRDDDRFKKLRDDIFGKQLRDPKLPRDPGPIKTALDPMPIGRPGSGTQPGTLRPFSVATPHHAPTAQGPGAVDVGEADLTSYLSELEQQLLDLEAAIAEANATTAQANANVARMQEAHAAVASTYEDVLNQLGSTT